MTKAASNRRKALYLGTALASALAAFHAAPALAQVAGTNELPQPSVAPVAGVDVLSGATLDYHSGNDHTLEVGLGNQSRVINWATFNIGKGSPGGGGGNVDPNVKFISSTTSQIGVLNRINDTNPSAIWGPITADSNIAVWLMNPNGFLFSNNGNFSGGSLVVTTANVQMPDPDPLVPGGWLDVTAANLLLPGATGLSGPIRFVDTRTGATVPPAGKIDLSFESGKGLFSTAAGKNIILVSQQIEANSGTISTPGTVSLVAAQNVTFPSGIGSPLSFTIDAGTTLTGTVVATGATVSGGSVALAAVSAAGSVPALLNVQSGATLTATATDGAVILATADYSGSGAAISVPENNDGIVVGGLVRATGTGGDVVVRSAGAFTASTTVAADKIIASDAVDIAAPSIKLDKAVITATGGALTLTGPVALTDSNVTLTGNSISLGTVDGDGTAGHGRLALNSGGTATLGGAIGASFAIESLTTDATGITALNGGSVTTSGAQTYNDAVALGANTILTSTGDKDVTLGGTVNGAYSLEVRTGGVTEFKGAVGGSTALTSVVTDLDGAAGEKTVLSGGLIKTSGAQTYNDPLQLAADAKLQITPGPGTLTIASVDGHHDLSIDVPALASIGPIGATDPLKGLALKADTVTFGAATQYVDTLAAKIGTGTFTFVNGQTLTVGTVDGLVGITAPAVSLTTTGASSDLKVQSPIDATTGGITLNAGRDALVDAALTASAGAVGVTATRDAAVAADVTAGAGNYDVTAVNVTLGKAATNVVQKTSARLNVTATTGDIIGLGDLDLISNSIGTNTFNSGATTLDAPGGKIDLGLASSIVADHAYVGVRAADGKVIALGDVTAQILSAYIGASTYSAGIVRSGSLTAGDIVLEDGLVATLTSGDFRAKSVTVNGPVFLNGPVITLNVAGDVTGVDISAAPDATNSDKNFARLDLTADNISVTAGGLVQLGTVEANAAIVSISAGSAGSDGSADILTLKNPGGDVNVTAYATSAANTAHDGDILVGFVDSGGAVSLDNKTAGGTRGDIVVTDAVQAAGGITFKAADDVLLRAYDATASAGAGAGLGTGFVKSNGGSITIEAQGSVYGIGGTEHDIGTTARGIGSLGAVGDLTITSTGDVRLGAVNAGGNLVLDIGGSLTGLAGGTAPATPLIGGSLFAEAPAQTITVKAGLAATGVVDVITLDKVKASSVTLQADLIGVNELTNTVGTATYSGPYYFGTYTVGTGVSSIPLGDAEGDGVTTLALVTTDTPGTDLLDAGFGSVNLTAGGSITTAAGHPIGYLSPAALPVPTTAGAQLGTVQAGTTIDIDAQAIVAGQVTSTAGPIDLLATAGTLSLTGASAGTNLTLTKLGGAATTAGDDLRVGIATAGRATPTVVAGAINLVSSTHVRTASATAQGPLTITAAKDVTGTLGGTGIRTDSTYGRGNLSIGGTGADLSVTAGGLVQLGSASSPRDLTIIAGNAGSDGAIDVTTLTANEDIVLNARAISPFVPAGRDGDILLGTVNATASVSIDNFTAAGDLGNVEIGGTVVAGSGLTIDSANDVVIAQYDAAANGGAGTGFLKATAGTIGITARGSVYTQFDNSLGTAARGIDSLIGTNLTLSSVGDARINDIDVTGNLALNVAGSLTGTAGTGTVTGAALLADGAGGAINVLAGTLPTDVAVFDKVSTSGNVSITAGAIGINTLTATAGAVTLTGAHYIGSALVGSSLSLTDAEGPATNAINAFTPYVADTVGGVDSLDPSFGRTTIDATGGVSTPSPIGGFAQLANVTAGTGVSVQAKATTGGNIVAQNGAIAMTASQGTLSLVKADASGNVALTKLNGSFDNAGDELRVDNALAGTPSPGTVTLSSSTHVRGSADALGTVSITAVGDVTGVRGGTGTRTDGNYSRGTLTASGAGSDVTVTAGGLVQLGTVTAGRDITLSAGDAAHDGAIDVTSATAANNLSLTAVSNAPSAPIDRSGDILLGFGQATGGSASLSNTGGDSGDIAIGDRLLANTGIMIGSTDDVRFAQYDAAANGGAGTGLVRTTSGAIAINADGSVYTTLENALEATRRGIDLLTGNNLTIASPGDVRLDSITVTGNLTFDVAGSLTGRLLGGGGGGGGGSTTVNGAALFAQGAGGNVTVNAGVAGLPSVDVISLDQIVASGAVSLSADQLAVRDIQSGGNLTLAGSYYLGSVTIGGGTITLGDGDGNGIDAVNVVTANEAATPLAPGFGKATITAGGAITSPSATSIGRVAQLGTVTAGGAVALDAQAITADSVTSSGGAINLLATAGTLAVGTAEAATSLTLTKQNGALATAGDELRLGTGHAGASAAGDAILISSTNVRAGTLDALGSITLTATAGDVTGLKGASTGTTDATYGRADVTATGALADVTVTSGGLAQLGPVAAGRNVTVTAGDATHNGAIDVSTATATSGNLILAATSASAGDALRDGDIALGTGVAGALARLSNVIGGGNTGLIELSGELTAGTDAIVDSASSARIAPIVSTGGSVAVRARTSVAGYAAGTGANLTAGTGTNPTGGQDVAVRAGTTALIDTVRADDDITLTATGTLTVEGTLTTTGLGPDTRSTVFTDPGNITFAAETVPGAGIVLAGDGVTVGGLVKSASSVAIAGGSSATTAGITAAGPITAGAGTVGVGAVGAGGAVTLTATSGPLTAASVSAGGTASLSAATTVAVAGATSAGSDLTVTAPGAVTLAGVSGANVSVTGGSVAAGATTASGNLAVASTSGSLALASASAGGTATITSATSASVTGNLAAIGDLTVTAPGAVTLATVSGRNVSLTGGTLSTGAVTATADLAAKSTSGALTLTSAAVTGSAAITSATNATVTGALTAGGDVSVTVPGAIALGTVAGRNVTLTGGTVNAGGTTTSGALNATSTTGQLTLASATVTGNAALTAATTATVTGALSAGGDLAVNAPGAIALGTVAGRNVTLTGGTINAGGTTASGALNATSTTGPLTLASATVTGNAALTSATTATVIGALAAGGDLAVNAPGAIALGTVAGRNVTLTGGTIAAGATTAAGNLTATTTTGALALASASASGTALLKSAAAATVTGALTSGSDVTVTAPGAVTVGSLGGRAVTVSGSAATLGPVTASGPLTVTTATGALTMGAATVNGAVTLTAATRATLAGVAAGSNNVTLTAADADINGAITGGTIKVIDKAAAPNTFVLGDGTTETGFNLSQDEVNRLDAATVTFDAGTALTPQNMRVGTLAIDGSTGSTNLNLLGVRRIDITGVLGATGSGSRAILIGGNGAAATDAANAATVLRVASLGSGGGRLIVPGVNLTLRANAIGVGQDALFLDSLGLNVGGTPLASTLVATDYVGNTFSTLYSSIRGGTAYTDPVLVSAGSLTVRYSNFALFQNSGLIAANTGLVLQTSAGTALDIRGLGTTQGGPVAVFGSINGITNAAAAVLGEPIITYSAAPSIDRSASRINGCLIGSGSACIGLNINPAQLPALDPIRDQLIDRPEGIEIPFDPLVGTNNESLFGDVGSFGLSDVPLDLVECKKDADGKCETPAQGAK